MIIYAPDPRIFFELEPAPSMTIPLASGGHIQAQNVENNQIRIVAISSTDPMDFLDPRYQPGNILSLDPHTAHWK